jgi:hypothetical protein
LSSPEREEVVGEYVNGGNDVVSPPVTLIPKFEYTFVSALKMKLPVALPPSLKTADISVQVNGTADAELAKDNMAIVAAATKAAKAFAFRGLPLRDEQTMIFLRRLWKIPKLTRKLT